MLSEKEVVCLCSTLHLYLTAVKLCLDTRLIQWYNFWGYQLHKGWWVSYTSCFWVNVPGITNILCMLIVLTKYISCLSKPYGIRKY